MSLIPCPDCGRDVSSLAAACIHCGRAMHAGAATGAQAPFVAGPECPLCAAPVVHPSARTGGKAWCERCGAQLIYGTDGALVRAVARGQAYVPATATPVPVVVVNERKSVGLAIVLAFLFGPLGIAYASVGGAIAMCLLTLFLMVPTMGLGLFLAWPASMLWAAYAATEHNRRQLYAARYV